MMRFLPALCAGLALAGCADSGLRDRAGAFFDRDASASASTLTSAAATPTAPLSETSTTGATAATMDLGLAAPDASGLYPGETPAMRALVVEYAARHDIPEALLHRVIQRESDYRPELIAGPYYGLMQVLPETARTMGFRGAPSELLDPRVNLEYGGRYLRGAWLVSDGDMGAAVGWYARGYYYEARNRCLLIETGLNDREIARQCR